MKMRITAILVLLMAGPLAWGGPNDPPSDASINELLTVTNARAMIDNILPQMHSMMKVAMQRALKGKEPTAEQKDIFDKMQTRVDAIYKEEFTWAKLQPMYARIYRASFTQSEIDGILKFYKSPAGQAMIKKMPVVMRNTMQEVQTMMGPMIEKIRDAAREVQQAEKSKGEPAPSN